MLRRVVLGIGLGMLFAPLAYGATPHFTACSTTTIAGLVAVTGQIAGLGNQQKPPTPLVLSVAATAVCLDTTTTPPTVLGSTPVVDSVTFPPKNGKFALVIDTPFVLVCAPPAEVVFAGIDACDVTHGICTPCPLPTPDPEP